LATDKGAAKDNELTTVPHSVQALGPQVSINIKYIVYFIHV